MTNLNEEVGKRLKAFRKRAGLSQEELADKLVVTRSFISKMENGKKKISLDHIENIARLLNVSTDDLLVEGDHLTETHAGLVELKSRFTKEQLDALASYASFLLEKEDR